MKNTKTILLLSSVVLLASCSRGKANINDSVITVGASSTPHAQILEQAKGYIEEKGYKLDVKVMTDYVTPNTSLNDGDLDANYFQHEPYLFDFNLNHETDIISVKKIHFEPMGIYRGTSNNGKIIIPNDKSNGDRARELLKSFAALLMFSDTDFTIVEMEAQSIPMMMDDCSYACINGNYALESGVAKSDKYPCVFAESKSSDIAYKNANVIAVKRGNENAQAIRVLVEALTQDNIRYYISDKFGSAVIPMF